MAISVKISELDLITEAIKPDLLILETSSGTRAISWESVVNNLVDNKGDGELLSVIIGGGSETLPSVSFQDSNRGLYSSGIGYVGIATNAVSRLEFKPSGEVLFGTQCGYGNAMYAQVPSQFDCPGTFSKSVVGNGGATIAGNTDIFGEVLIVVPEGQHVRGRIHPYWT